MSIFLQGLLRRISLLFVTMVALISFNPPVNAQNQMDTLMPQVPQIPQISMQGQMVGQQQAHVALMGNRITVLENQIRMLTGQIEQQGFVIRQMQQTIQSLQAGNANTSNPVQQPQTQNNIGNAFPQNQQQQSFSNERNNLSQPQMPVTSTGNLPVPQQQSQQQVTQQAIPQTQNLPPNTLGVLRETPQGSVVTPPSQNPTMMYDQAFSLLRNGEYEQAESALAQFIAAHPQHPLAANAQYWLGETYYVRNDFDKAAKAFARGYQSYPDNPKAPDNLLKLALSLSNIGQNDSACATLGQLTSQFQTAPQAILRKANEEKQRIQCG